MNLFKHLIPQSLRSKGGIAIIATAAVLVGLTSAVQLWYTETVVHKEMEQRAQSELLAMSLEIEKTTNAVETAVQNMAWAVENSLFSTDSLYAIGCRMVEQNKQIVGTGIMFVANYFPQYGRWCELYITRHSDGNFKMEQIGGPDHDYLNRDWFKASLTSKNGYWSEPYYDNAGALTMVSSYIVPIHDRKGQVVGAFGADMSLDWLTKLANTRHLYPSSFNLLLSREGRIMTSPVDSLLLRQSSEQVEKMEDTTMRYVNRQMLEGRSGQAVVTDDNGRKNRVFFAKMNDGTGWSMAVICPDREIFYGLRQMTFNLILLTLVGLGLLGFIIRRAAKNARHLQEVNAEKERMGTELHIAGEIQSGMLPKIFPPYPERDDVDIYATLVPAKEVGGDLYDFFIRDDKLFFCIGDVSGKGVPASLVMAVTRSLFRTLSGSEGSPEVIVTQMNNSMAETNESNMFVTLFLGVLDLATGKLRYCNAGHCPPVISQPSPLTPSFLNVRPNLPVGMIEGWKYEGQETLIAPQSTIFLYTDGLTEAENAMHGQFGKQRMLKNFTSDSLSAREGTGTPKDIIEHMSTTVHAYVGGAEQSDDLTMLAIQYTKEDTK